MRPSQLLTLLGFIILIAATYCPMLRPFHLFNWNVYQLNRPYGIVIMLTGVIGILGTVLGQQKLTRWSAWAGLILVGVLFIAAILKVKTTFSFIPFKSVNAYLSRQIKFKWGWYALFSGALIALAGSLLSKKPIFKIPVK
ncbi:hypothetical protein [Mucilaginibacter segetis]|uniref:Uncharacterized protein n=1 Tax=Mucilaginibacter segetis TaxID=2793071 RepID=A0A934PTX2_9SPHI|nr:hypothetical protein [Mucilaginibacter segetis]MBK0378995.1 hypothetical protein [Mucilaginibacter segetis]